MHAHPHFLSSIDYSELVSQFPMGSAFMERFQRSSRDHLYAQQSQSFLRVMSRAWQVPFYQHLWGREGIEPGDIRSLEDLPKLPLFDKHDLMASIERAPPWGDYHGIDDFAAAKRHNVIMHTTSGTTGRPQIIPFGPRTRTVQNLVLGRLYQLQGLRPEDVVQSVYGHGLVNGGHYIREAITQWTGALLLSAGTGIETPSAKQLELMREFSVTVLVGFCDYLIKLASMAKAEGHDMHRDYRVRMISGHLGAVARATLSTAWGEAEVYDWYGVGDTGVIAGEAADCDGLYVMEDAHVLEILDVDSAEPVPVGQPGDMVVTCLFKDDVYPIIRFNTHDVTTELDGVSSLGLNLRRIGGFAGRSDNMVKLKGINVFPDGIGALFVGVPGLTGEYQCRLVDGVGGVTHMNIHVEVDEKYKRDATDALSERIKQRLGVRVGVIGERPGDLTAATGVEERQKPRRLRDDRSNIG